MIFFQIIKRSKGRSLAMSVIDQMCLMTSLMVDPLTGMRANEHIDKGDEEITQRT